MVTLGLSRGEKLTRVILPRYTRMSIRLEDPDDIIADFEQAE